MTLRAAILPGGLTAIVLADDATDPPTTVLATSYEVGRLVDRVEPLRSGGATLDKERAIGPADIAALLDRVGRELVTRAPASVVVGLPESRGAERSRMLHGELMGLCAALGIEATGRRVAAGRGFTVGHRIAGWPDGARAVVERAGALWLMSFGGANGSREVADGSRQSLGAPSPGLTPQGVAEGFESGPVAYADGSRVGSIGARAAEPSPPASERRPIRNALVRLPSPPEAPPVRQPVALRAGIDPGSARLALCIASGTAPPLAQVYLRTFPVGELVPLAKPKHGVRADGQPWTQTHRRSVTVAHVMKLADDLAAILREHGVPRVILESLGGIHLGGESDAAKSAQATALMHTRSLETAITLRCADAGIEVVPVHQATWRARVVGREAKRGGSSGDARIAEAVSAGFANWPADAEVDEHDAAGCALFDVTAEREPRTRTGRVRKSKARVRTPEEVAELDRTRAERKEAGLRRWQERLAAKLGTTVEEMARQREAKAIEREQAGCVCGNKRKGRHRAGCPVATRKPTTAERLRAFTATRGAGR